MKTTLKSSLILATLLAAANALAGSITVKGSDTLVVLAQKWAEIYMSKNPAVKIQVTGGGSGIGFAALQNNQTDIANASRAIKPAERVACIKAFGKNPREYKVALDGLSIYVHSDNPINELSLDQLKEIFTGKVRNWKDLGGSDGPITAYSRENSSGTYEFFKEHILKERPNDARNCCAAAGGVEGQDRRGLRRRGLRPRRQGAQDQEDARFAWRRTHRGKCAQRQVPHLAPAV
jgi:phosphate transport system substrate-binding protein